MAHTVGYTAQISRVLIAEIVRAMASMDLKSGSSLDARDKHGMWLLAGECHIRCTRHAARHQPVAAADRDVQRLSAPRPRRRLFGSTLSVGKRLCSSSGSSSGGGGGGGGGSRAQCGCLPYGGDCSPSAPSRAVVRAVRAFRRAHVLQGRQVGRGYLDRARRVAAGSGQDTHGRRRRWAPSPLRTFRRGSS